MQKDLFGNNVPNPGKSFNVPGKRKAEVAYEQLKALHGLTPGKKCNECEFLKWRFFSKAYPKCTKSGCSGASRSSDWNSRWPACGLFIQQKED